MEVAKEGARNEKIIKEGLEASFSPYAYVTLCDVGSPCLALEMSRLAMLATWAKRDLVVRHFHHGRCSKTYAKATWQRKHCNGELAD
ncbi:hypothetical protein PIB30_057037 [Stylosanthes scabra]|uniref:Uncharacterized protein n=1 Tax=Stylosanthes scabra TaxID=79078 RepID=A0ABU6TLQ3_9FABA|nr:hypothetical protein [Stylosanthes scabra]